MSGLEAWVLIVSTGAVLAATMTPGAEAPRSLIDSCDTSRLGPAPLSAYLRFGTTSLNVLLFVPLGWAVTRIGRPRGRAVAVLLAVLLPIAIEVTQLLAAPLGRACQVPDVIDNLIGLGIGLALGLGVELAATWSERRGAQL
jgi:VanZ family protein